MRKYFGVSIYTFYGNYYVYLCVYIVMNDYLCVYIIMRNYLCVYIIMHDYIFFTVCLKHIKRLIIYLFAW